MGNSLMEERQFRIILALLALTAVAVFTIGIVSVVTDNTAGERVSAHHIVQLVAMSLLPIAAIGLWWWRRWAFWMLGLATALALVAALPDGIFAAVWCSFLHLTTILLVAEQYYARQESEAENRSDGHDDGGRRGSRG